MITGWRLPKGEKMIGILCSQLAKKLRIDYPGILHDEIENAFLKFGSEENFTGAMSIAIIDRVLKKYFATVAADRFDAERSRIVQPGHALALPLISPQQHLNECRELIEHKYMLYSQNRLNIELIPTFIWPVLIKDFGAPDDLPQKFIYAGKEFIRELRGKRKFGSPRRSDDQRGKRDAVAIGEAMGGTAITDDSLNEVATKLAIEECFKEFKKMNYQHLYAYVS